MSRLGSVLEDFRSHKNAPPKRGTLAPSLQGIKKNVVVLVPVMKDPVRRFHFMTLCLQIAWSAKASGAFITGAFFSLLSIFVENPGSLIRSMLNDPDIDVQIAEVSDVDNDKLHLVTRGREMERYEAEIMRMASAGPADGVKAYPYVNSDYNKITPRSTEDVQIAIQTVTAQLWILLTKAVTAIDTARDSEARRWIKYEQQRRAAADYRLNDTWLGYARNRMASDLAIRRFMVEILVSANKAASPKSRVLELICDIGNYISEAGLAGFFLTIKYGIETKYPALALNELQADLATVLSLMKCYMSLGEKGPFMVLLEDSVQTKFSPGAYPLLWSYAMGVGATLDRAVHNLNYSRTYLEQSFYNLGVSMVEKMEGSVNKQVAEELGLTQDQISQIKELVKQEADQTGGGSGQGPKIAQGAGRFKPADDEELVPSDDEDSETKRKVEERLRELKNRKMAEIEAAEREEFLRRNRQANAKKDESTSRNMREQIASILRPKSKPTVQDSDTEAEANQHANDQPNVTSDIDAMNA